MRTLAQQLMDNGLVSGDFLEKTHEQERTTEGQHLSSSRFQNINATARSVDDLEKCETVGEFKTAAKAILLVDIEHINVVVKKAHMFKERDCEGHKRLIGMMYALREALNLSKSDEYERIINQAFRKAGGVVHLPNNDKKKKKKK